MKSFVIFAAVLAVAAAALNPIVSVWTQNELSEAIQNPETNPAQLPYLEAALDEMMWTHATGVSPAPVILALPVQMTWTFEEIITQLQDSNVHPVMVPFLEQALDSMMVAMHSGHDVPFVTVNIPAFNVNMWTLNELSEALQNPETDPELAIYLEHAIEEFMTALFAGNSVTAVAVVTPPGVPVTAPEPIKPEPVIVDPGVPVEPPLPIFPVAPEPVQPEEPLQPIQPEPVASSPLVQVIININAQEQAPVFPETVIDPIDAIDPVNVVDEAVNIIAPVFPVIVPEPIIVPEPVILPEPIIPQPIIPEPIIVGPEPVVVNPIDIIAVGEPEINPVDLINPIPVVLPSPALDGIIV